jgi:hypothetical protein
LIAERYIAKSSIKFVYDVTSTSLTIGVNALLLLTWKRITDGVGSSSFHFQTIIRSTHINPLLQEQFFMLLNDSDEQQVL